MIQGKRLLLASASPRRRELLSSLDSDVEIVKLKEVDENYPASLPALEVAHYVACLKRDAYKTSQLADNEILVTADTVVVLDGKVLGKPHSTAEAYSMLRDMSGKTHTVVTGVTLSSNTKTVSFATTTEVTFDNLTDDQINYYIDKYAPMDKAGAYGIQEWIGYIGIKGINGCYYNVMGLPLHDLYQHLLQF
ncbi:MAG: Maf-like protein [Muribaculaceae bacterium]|nr:Maf-like protein [Muribaculaceae bacterium]